MNGVKWIKLSTDIFDNRKIKQIESLPEGDTMIVIWLKLLILASDVNDNGFVYFTRDIPYTDQLLATQFGKPLPVIQLSLETFRRFGMIEKIDDIIKVSNWDRYQNGDFLSEIREYNREAKRRSRERQKALPASKKVNDEVKDKVNKKVNDKSMTNLDSQGQDIDIDIDKDIEREIDKEKEKTRTGERFAPPTLEEVSAYCRERCNAVNAADFIDYYESIGWMVGRNKMRDWRAAVRRWERDSKRRREDPAKKSFETDEFFNAAVARGRGNR